MAKNDRSQDQLTFGEKGKGRWSHLLKEFPQGEISRQPDLADGAESVPSADPATFAVEESPAETEGSERIYSVSEINKAIKNTLEGTFSYLWLQGEISNFKAHTSGHYYFSLKDEKSQITAVMFKGFNGKIKFMPENGMEVLVRGKITVYEPRGNYQMFVEHMEPVGAGALQKAFEQLKNKLQQEGLFDQAHKKPLPSHPNRVAVVTSPTGAAIRDILNVIGRRSPRVEVTVIPARVQGQTAAAEVVKGIELANLVGGFDVLIVGRGGGSVEDLWCFNEEVVARAIFKSKIPIISAVGHEIDFTISDFVADVRAPTPSAAAELVAKSEEQLREQIAFSLRSLTRKMFDSLQRSQQQVVFLRKNLQDPRRYLRDSILRCDELVQRLHHSWQNNIEQQRLRIQAMRHRLPSPMSLLATSRMKLNNNLKTLIRSIAHLLGENRATLKYAVGMLDSLSPLQVVQRGYGIVRAQGKVVRSINQVKENQEIDIQLADGYLVAQVKEKKVVKDEV